MESQNPPTMQAVPTNTELAFERTLLAHERTLMAWMRTSTSMISFGFTIYKFFSEMNKSPDQVRQSILSPRIVGMIMIGFGLIALLLAELQHRQAIRKIRYSYPNAPKSTSSLMAALTLLLGMALFLGALFRQ